MNEAVIVSTARTPIGKAFRGAFNDTHAVDLAAHTIHHAVARAGLEPGEVEDVILGCATPEGVSGRNFARLAAFRAGLSINTPGVTVHRFCASGLQAIAIAANAIRTGDADIMVAGGVESISLQPNDKRNTYRADNDWIRAHRPSFYMPMIETADIVAARYGVDRAMQDAYSAESQRRTAAAQEAGYFDAEIVPMPSTRVVFDKQGNPTGREDVCLARDEGNRPGTTVEALARLAPVRGPEYFITAGNASQLSDGASACVVMNARLAERRGLSPLGVFKGFVAAALEPDEMGIGPVLAVPKLLQRHGLQVNDIDLWELNEAFAVQVVYCRDRLGIPSDRLNVNGGAVSIGHPYGMSGSRLAGHALIEGRRRGVKRAVVTMCVAGGQGAAALLEIA